MRGRASACACVTLLFALLVGACEHRGGQPLTMAELRAEHAPVQEIQKAEIRTSDGGRPRLQIEASLLRKYESSDSTYVVLSGDTAAPRVTVRLFDENGQPSAVLTADNVTTREDTGQYEARGDVEVVTVDGKRLASEQLVWNESERIVRTSGFVHIKTPSEELRGYELEAEEDLDTYTLRRVTGRGTIRDD